MMEQVNGRMVVIATTILIQMIVAAEMQYSSPVVQNIPDNCSGVRDCPQYFDQESWDRVYQAECCRAQKGPIYHCQQSYVDEDGSHTEIRVACVYPKTCAAGNYAFVKSWSEGGRLYADIECRPCTHDRFQPVAQESFLFRIANCTDVWRKCLREDGFALVRPGNATHDNLCRCWWEGGYRPIWNTPKCRSLDGFDQDDCQCEPAPPCPDGQALNDEFRCVPKISSSTTTHRPSSDTPKTTDKQRVGNGSVTITSGATLVFALFVSFSTICCI